MSNCIFCRIVAGEIPATFLAENAECIAFRDINAQAPTHVLVIPREHVASVNDLASTATVAELTAMARTVARTEGIADSGYRLVVNTGGDGGQTVFHLHLHLLGGRAMGWPPG